MALEINRPNEREEDEPELTAAESIELDESETVEVLADEPESDHDEAEPEMIADATEAPEVDEPGEEPTVEV